jgi:hypothetical protein
MGIQKQKRETKRSHPVQQKIGGSEMPSDEVWKYNQRCTIIRCFFGTNKTTLPIRATAVIVHCVCIGFHFVFATLLFADLKSSFFFFKKRKTSLPFDLLGNKKWNTSSSTSSLVGAKRLFGGANDDTCLDVWCRCCCCCCGSKEEIQMESKAR